MFIKINYAGEKVCNYGFEQFDMLRKSKKKKYIKIQNIKINGK